MLIVYKKFCVEDITLGLWLWLLWNNLILHVRSGLVFFVFLLLAALPGPGMMGTSSDCLQLISKSAKLPLPVWGVLPHPTKAKYT